MVNASKDLLAQLTEFVETAATPLAKVTKRRMFGCDGFFAGGSIFGLIWKAGRIGVRLPDAALYDELIATRGAGPWMAGAMKMSHWVLVPEAFHDDDAALAKWIRKAHVLAMSAPVKKTKPKKKR